MVVKWRRGKQTCFPLFLFLRYFFKCSNHQIFWIIKLSNPLNNQILQILKAATSNLVTYPNPSNGSFYIDFYTQDLTGPSSISVFDSRGVIIYRQDVLVEKGSNVFHIEKMDAAPGMYYIQVSNGTTTSYIVKHSLR